MNILSQRARRFCTSVASPQRRSVISNDNVNDVDFYEIWHTGVLITTCPGIDIALEEGFD